jgi:multidrug resistance efflux pump
MTRETTSFARTMRALDADGMGPTLLTIVLVAGLAGVWTSWLLTARVPVYQLSERARLEMERVHPVAATVSGRVVATSLSLGREVKKGDVLLEVEADREWLATAEERTRLQSLRGEAAALEREIIAEQQASAQTRQAARAALTEANERLAASEAAAEQASNKLRRLNQLEQQHLVASAEVETARAEERARRAELAAAGAGIARLKAEQIAADRERHGQLAALARERVGLQGLSAAAEAIVARTEREADRRRIRAPVAGRLGEVNPVQVGAVVRDGDRLASIVPTSTLLVVAELAPPALGRVRPGQPARVRLEGFPWTQYGHVDASVRGVATETREQRVRVELAIARVRATAIPLEHGMPGVVEIEIERVAPLALLLRSLGYVISGQEPSSAAPSIAEARAQ